MRADPIQRAIDEDLVRVLYAQDPIAFFTHWFSIAVLVAIYWNNIPHPHLFAACFIFYGFANCASLALWMCNRRWPEAVSPRTWINLHAARCSTARRGSPSGSRSRARTPICPSCTR